MSALTLLVAIAAVIVGSSLALLVLVAAAPRGRWELLDWIAFAISIALLMSGLQLLSWSLYAQDERH
jgi:hypothetical protein